MGIDAIPLPSKCSTMKHHTIVKKQTSYYNKWPQTFTIFLIYIVVQCWLKESHLSESIWKPRLTSFEIPLFQAFDTLHRSLNLAKKPDKCTQNGTCTYKHMKFEAWPARGSLFGHLCFLGQENRKESQDHVLYNSSFLLSIIRSLA